MATFLEMCVTTMQEGGLTGNIVSTVSQAGIHKVVVDAVATADYSIQGKYTNWKFLWAEWSQTLDIGANSGLFNEYDPPADIGVFIDNDYATKINGNAITVAEYERVRALASSVATGTPSVMIVLPNGRVRMSPIPTAADLLTAEYYRAPVRMMANNDVSIIPPKHHRAILALAIANVHAFNGDIDNYKLFMGEHTEEMIKLESDQLLGHALRTNASGEDNVVRAE